MTLPTPAENERSARLRSLEIAVRAHGFVADLIGDTHVRVHTEQRPSVQINVRCAPRGADDGRLWFAEGDHWLAQADDITGTLVALKGLTAASRPEPGRVPGRDVHSPGWLE